jgi:DNA (cytosine-5)-methyltransferase 1
MNFGSLFAGIGGMDLGLERAGMQCRWQVEIDPFARRVLAKHWPDVRRWDDVRTFPPVYGAWGVDLIAGGFPCQDISGANVYGSAGINGARSGLWRDFARCVRVLRPRYVVVENSPRLANRGLGRVLGDLAEIGYDAEWSCVSACSVGAPHARSRLFVIAHAHGQPVRVPRRGANVEPPREMQETARQWQWLRADTLAAARGLGARVRAGTGGSDPRVPHRVDRLRGLGNAVVPQVAEFIGRRILEFDKEEHDS